jgi:hypothetical protein
MMIPSFLNDTQPFMAAVPVTILLPAQLCRQPLPFRGTFARFLQVREIPRSSTEESFYG